MRALYWYIGGAVAGGVAWWLFGDPEPDGVVGDIRQTFLDAVNGITQGARLTRAPYDKTTGVVPGDPQALADLAGATLDEYALARNIASEHPNSSAALQALLAHATVNAAAAAGRSVAQQLLHATNPAHSGRFGTQRDIDPASSRQGKSDRYASTAQDPYEGHLAVARGVLDGSIPDLSGGATNYDDISGLSDPAGLQAKREAAGLERVPGLEDIIGSDFELWRPVN